MNEIISKLNETNELLKRIINEKEPTKKTYKITEEGGLIQTMEEEELLVYINKKYNVNVKANGLKNLTKLKDVKTNSKYKKIFGENFELELK